MSKWITAVVIVGVALFAPAAADAQAGPPIDNQAIVLSQITMDPQLVPAPPIRQLADVWFHRTVVVGRSMLQGRYVIEHDNERMARGEPCTHLYAYEDYADGNLKKPVVAFHCTHLERPRASHNTVFLATASDPGMKVLMEFQFAGETASHGYPTGR